MFLLFTVLLTFNEYLQRATKKPPWDLQMNLQKKKWAEKHIKNLKMNS